MGKRYLIPLLLAPEERETSEWMYLSDDTIFPLDGEGITTEGVSERGEG